MIKIIDSILNKDELNYLVESVCPNFINSNQYNELDGLYKSYNSMFIDEYSQIERFKQDMSRIVKDMGYDYRLNVPGVFINKIDTLKNQNDKYHNDGCDLTVIVYLNDDFEGGEFEYVIDNKLHHITPSGNLTIVMDRSIPHRVLPVTNGTRYSLISWFNRSGLI